MTQGSEPAGSPSSSQWLQIALREIAETVLPALIIVLALNLFLIQSTRVQMQSMEPNLHEGELLILEKISYRFRPPQRGEIVVFRLSAEPTSHLIKRVIALPGETIEIRDGRVYIDGDLLDEPYASPTTYPSMRPLRVPPESIFVLGDNRGLSNDSRSFGPVAYTDIMGRAWLRYWPLDRIGLLG